MNEIKVSVICNAYNHGKYIGECLAGLVMQETDFAYEILVHDDASPDETASVIRDYEKRYPDLIKPVYQKENQYSKGIDVNSFQYPRVSGEYIALCEGDDYWTDKRKLQKQVDKMDCNPDVDICTHAVTVIDAQSNKKVGKIAPSNKETIFPAEDVIMGEGGFVATNSILYRASLNDNVPEYRQILKFDYSIQIQGSLRGGMLYLPEDMAVYRHEVPGSWSAKRGKENLKAFTERKRRMLDALDAETGGRYHDVIRARSKLNDLIVDDYKAALNKDLLFILRYLPLKKKVKVLTLSVFPKIKKIKQLTKRY